MAMRAFAVCMVASAAIGIAAAAAPAATPGQTVSGVAPQVVTSGAARLIGPLDPSTRIPLTLALRPRRQAELERLLTAQQQPGSHLFQHFLTFEQWKTSFAPSDADVRAVTGWARSRGLSVSQRFRDNLAVAVTGDVATVERAFGIRMNRYASAGGRFYSTDRDPTLPTTLARSIRDVVGLDSYRRFVAAGGARGEPAPVNYRSGPFLRTSSAGGNGRHAGRLAHGRRSPSVCCSSDSLLEPPDLWSSEAYDLKALQRLGHCCNPAHATGGTPREESIAIIGGDAISFDDVRAFAGRYGLAWNVTQVQLDNPACCSSEMTLDAEYATAMSNSFGSLNDTAHVYLYEGKDTLSTHILDAWHKALSDNATRSASTSFGAYEGFYGGDNPEIDDFRDVTNAMSSIGWSIAASAGDNGAYDDCQSLNVEYPASDTNAVAVGGTSLSMTRTASGSSTYKKETSWGGDGCGGQPFPGAHHGGGGGGCSGEFAEPEWQSVAGIAFGCNPSRRVVPDLALNAGVNSVLGTGTRQVEYFGGNWTSDAGTSMGAPELAGFFAQENAWLASVGRICGDHNDQPCTPLGNAGPAVWVAALAALRDPYYDITEGCSGGNMGTGWCTKQGYDLATGWGSPNLFQLAWFMNLRRICCFPEPQILFAGSPQTDRWYSTDQQVVITAYSPPLEGTDTSPAIVGISARWDQDPDAPTGHATPGSGDAFYDGPQVLGVDDTLSLEAAGLGCHTARVFAWDNTGRSDYRRYGPLCFDNVKPVVTCGSADGFWHAADVQIECTASDALSGLFDFHDAHFFLSTSVPAGTETADASTGSHEVLDVAGNFVIAGPIGGNKIDKKPPDISIFSPAAGTYTVRQAVPASYACSDGGSGTASCAGPVPSGSNIDTATVGTKTFTVNSADNVANGTSRSVTYDVTYKICLLYDPTKPSSARGFAIRLQLCDANNANVSAQSIAVTAVAVDGATAEAKPLGSLNPGNLFLYGPGTAPGASYLYNLDTKGLADGSHVLTFTVHGDPIVHAAQFTLG